MNVNRRTFLTLSSTVLFVLLMFPSSAFAQTLIDPSGLMGRSEYAARIKHWFYLYNEDATHQGNLQLIGVRDETTGKRVEQFALTLRSELMALAMPSGYYEVAGEPFALFVKHTHEQGGRQFYRAEFALLR